MKHVTIELTLEGNEWDDHDFIELCHQLKKFKYKMNIVNTLKEIEQ